MGYLFYCFFEVIFFVVRHGCNACLLAFVQGYTPRVILTGIKVKVNWFVERHVSKSGD